MAEKDSQTEGLVAEDYEDKVKDELVLELGFGFLELDESILNEHGFVLSLPLFAQMHKVNVEGRVFLIEVRVVFLCLCKLSVEIVDTLQTSNAFG